MRRKRQEIVKIERVPDIPFIRVVSGSAVVNDFARHVHGDLCIGIVVSGRRHMTVGSETCDLSAGDIFIMNPGQPHICTSADGEPHSYSVIVVDAGLLSETGLSKAVFRNFIRGDVELTRRMTELLGVLLSDERRIGKESTLYSFLEVLVRGYASGSRDDRESAVPEAVSRVREYIDAHCAEELSLEELSSVAGLSPFHLNRLFCAEVGMAPHTWQLHRRIEKAKHLLLQNRSIADTALAAGFSDQSHFTKFFRRIVGTTPANFIKWNS